MHPDCDITRLRCYCDGELSPEEAAEVERLIEANPDLKARVAAERELRGGVARALSGCRVPAGLAGSVSAAMASEQAGASAIQRTGASASREESGALRLQWLWPRQRVSVFAAAASIAVIGAAVLYGIFGPQIDQVQPFQTAPTLVSDIAEYVSSEHDRCVGSEQAILSKLTSTCMTEASFALSEHLGVDGVTVFDLSAAGYEFVGEGRCNVPGRRPSAHLVYRKVAPDPDSEPARSRAGGRAGGKLLSVFMTPDGGRFGCAAQGLGDPGQWRKAEGGPSCRRLVLGATDSSVAYFVVGCDPDDLERVSEAIGGTLGPRFCR